MLTPFRDDPAQLLLFKIASALSAGGGVSSFNTRTGAVTLTSGDVTGALGFTPISAADGNAAYVLKAGDTMTGLLSVSVASVALRAISSDAGTANTPLSFEIYHRTSGVAGAAFGSRLQFYADSSTTPDQPTGRIDSQWVDATHATRSSQLVFGVRATGGVVSSPLILRGGQLLTLNGTAALPTFAFANDTTSGGYLIAAGSFGVSAGGVSKMFWSAAGATVVGSLNLAYVAKTATYTATALDYFIKCTANSFTVNLPTAVGIAGRVYVIKNSGAGSITIDPAGSETIDGSATATVATTAVLNVASDGANWFSF